MNKFVIIGIVLLVVIIIIAVVAIIFTTTSEPTTTPAAETTTSSPAAETTTPSPAAETTTPSPAAETTTPATFPNLIPSNATTPWNDEGGGNLIYLDRHDVACPDKAGMTRFHLTRRGDNKYAQEYSCLAGSDFSDASNLTTPANDWGGGNTVYLDRHNVACPEGSVINQWRLLRPKDNQIHISYKCSKVPGLGSCENLSTPWNDEGRGNAVYLDRHDVKCPGNKMLTKHLLVRSGKGTYRYDFTCCGR